MLVVKIASAFVQGRSHIKNNTPCQDRTYSIIDAKKGFYCLSLADGAGSYKMSHIGAEIITKYVAELFHSNYEELFDLEEGILKKRIVSHLIAILNESAKEHNTKIEDLSSTLLFVAIQNNSYIAGHLGDGVIGYLNYDNIIEVLSHPENGEFSNSTYFVPSNDSYLHLRIFKGDISRIKGFILMSDGSEESLYDKKNKKLAPVNAKIINWLFNNTSQKVERALNDNLEKAIKLRTFDDCSLGVIAIAQDVSYIVDADIDIQKEVLNSNNIKYIKKQIKIINSIYNLKCKTPKEIKEATRLRPRTIKRHLKNLKRLKII